MELAKLVLGAENNLKWLVWFKENKKELAFNTTKYDFQIEKPDIPISGFDKDGNWKDELYDKKTKNCTIEYNIKAEFEDELKKKFLAYIQKNNLNFETVMRLREKRNEMKMQYGKDGIY